MLTYIVPFIGFGRELALVATILARVGVSSGHDATLSLLYLGSETIVVQFSGPDFSMYKSRGSRMVHHIHENRNARATFRNTRNK